MRRFALFILLSLTLAGCSTPAAPRPWAAEDLRLLDPLDAPTPSSELLALYTRTVGLDLEIRLDLLDLPLVPDSDLTLRLVTSTGDLLIHLPARGRPSILPADSPLRIRLVRDPWLDTVTVRLNRLYIPQPFRLQAFASLPGQPSPADETDLVRSDSLPPIGRAPVLLAFWDVYPAYTPAQALRRWDGAHTGPRGGRHGLRHLLNAVETWDIPVVLLDLKTPASLAALSFDGALPQVQRLTQQGLLLLPQTAYSQPVDKALEFSARAAEGFGLPGSEFTYAAGMDLLPASRAQFLALSDSSHLARFGGTRLVPLPALPADQATADGPSLEVRRRLLEALFSPDESDLVVLGGSLRNSTWGDGEFAPPTFAWLAGHPWVTVLDREGLLSFPVGQTFAPPPVSALPADPWLEALRRAPQNAVTQSAWQMYLELNAPASDSRLQELRRASLGQIGLLLEAASWADSPARRADCTTDPDGDGRPECLLANERYFAVIETNGARLTYLFYRDASGPHQVIAPTVQFVVGLSDPSQWHPERGDAADPGAVMGAFSDLGGAFDEYAVRQAEAGRLVLEGSKRSKQFRLGENGLEVTYQETGLVSAALPLAVDASRFYAGPAAYQAVLVPGSSWTWGPADGIRVEVRTDAALSAEAFTFTQQFLGGPEDPNQNFPPGHYLPFPFSLVTVSGEGTFTVWLEAK